MSQHRGPRQPRGLRSRAATPGGGRRRRVGWSPGALVPSPSAVAGVAALVAAGAGAVTVGSAQATTTLSPDSPETVVASQAAEQAAETADGHGMALSAGQTLVGTDGRDVAISRGYQRRPLADRPTASAESAEAEAERHASAREKALAQLRTLAAKRSEEIKARQWVLPVHGYRLTARFGQGGGLWSRDHTGLDFAAPYGTSIHSVAHGIVTETGYDGAYGLKTVITHDDGTQTWYCHQATVDVSVGQEVQAGQPIGAVGMTGNTTGPHLHLEVRPNPETPIDPYSALVSHGLHP